MLKGSNAHKKTNKKHAGGEWICVDILSNIFGWYICVWKCEMEMDKLMITERHSCKVTCSLKNKLRQTYCLDTWKEAVKKLRWLDSQKC